VVEADTVAGVAGVATVAEGLEVLGVVAPGEEGRAEIIEDSRM
jgi:hypothetical protein